MTFSTFVVSQPLIGKRLIGVKEIVGKKSTHTFHLCSMSIFANRGAKPLDGIPTCLPSSSVYLPALILCLALNTHTCGPLTGDVSDASDSSSSSSSDSSSASAKEARLIGLCNQPQPAMPMSAHPLFTNKEQDKEDSLDQADSSSSDDDLLRQKPTPPLAPPCALSDDEDSQADTDEAKLVEQIDLVSGDAVAAFATQVEAARSLCPEGSKRDIKMSQVCINKVLNGDEGRLSHHGFGWRFRDSRKVVQIDLVSGDVVATFATQRDAATSLWPNGTKYNVEKSLRRIYQCCYNNGDCHRNKRKRRTSHGNFGWGFLGETHNVAVAHAESLCGVHHH